MKVVEQVVTILTGVAIFALIVNYPDVPLKAVQAIAKLSAEVIGLATASRNNAPTATA